jgi:ABC-type transporter Mla MlaB component
MLRITKIDTPSEQKLILEGRLTEPWIADLSSHWKETRHAHPERKFVVDIRGVMRIDSAGEGALALMKTEGAEFLASGIRMKHLVKDLEIEAQQKSHSRAAPTVITCRQRKPKNDEAQNNSLYIRPGEQ